MDPKRRFIPGDLRYLATAGWYPGRDIGDQINLWLAQNASALAELVPSPAALAFLREFGGLRVAPEEGGIPIPNAQASHFYPTDRLQPVLGSFGLREEYGLDTFPIGYCDEQFSPLVMDRTGRVFLVHWSGDLYLGHQDRAISRLISAIPGYPIDRDLLWADTGEAG